MPVLPDRMALLLAKLLVFSSFLHPIFAQQYAGDVINNTLPSVPRSQLAYFRITDPAGKNNNLTLINYYATQVNFQPVVPSALRRAVIVIHGLNRDPYTYISQVAHLQLATFCDR